MTIESVPLDVTLFMDTSGSTAGALDRMKGNVISIAKMLRPDDQFRLLTIGLSVDTPVPWQRAGNPITLDMKAVPGISLVYDALFVALTHAPAAGPPASDRRDDRWRGLRQPARWRARARCERPIRSGAALDLRQQPGRFRSERDRGWCTPNDAHEVDFVEQSAIRTGGDKHQSRFGDPAVRTFAQILDEFRQSYVLRYSAQGVKGAGWHAVSVQVPAQPGLTIKARSGYFGTP